MTHILWPQGEEVLQSFREYINSQHPYIQFTREEEPDNKLPFLDVLVKQDGNRASTTVYRKPTYSDRCLNYKSHHYPRILTGVVKCLRNRADKVCDQEHHAEEISYLHKTFRNSGYPNRLLDLSL